MGCGIENCKLIIILQLWPNPPQPEQKGELWNDYKDPISLNERWGFVLSLNKGANIVN